ncbi:MAG: hypothetical protein K2G30_09120 [Muribaculaceae bacterium]|nr:hypothetical protein [Muribaculaceae bacterium]
MYFSIDNILPIVWVALAVAALSAGWVLYAGLGRARRVSKAASAAADDAGAGNPLPGVTVVVYARDNAADLEEMLPAVLGQDYPGDWEVLVINDGKDEGVTDVVNLFSTRLSAEGGRPPLRITFIPEEAHNLSRQKLAVSLGVKGARYPYLVLTSALCRVGSRNWLRGMCRHFAAGKEVVIGWAPMRGLESLADRYDQVATASVWLDAGLRGKPIRGTGYNLGYSRRLFQEAKGFSRSLNLRAGDDDIFINQISTGENTAVELSADTRVEIAAFRPHTRWRHDRLQAFTARFLPGGAGRLAGSATLALWLWLAATAVGVVFSLPNWMPSCVFAALALGLWIPVCRGWSRCARALGVGLSAATLWWPMLWHWARTLVYRLLCGRASRNNYTWLQR